MKLLIFLGLLFCSLYNQAALAQRETQNPSLNQNPNESLNTNPPAYTFLYLLNDIKTPAGRAQREFCMNALLNAQFPNALPYTKSSPATPASTSKCKFYIYDFTQNKSIPITIEQIPSLGYTDMLSNYSPDGYNFQSVCYKTKEHINVPSNFVIGICVTNKRGYELKVNAPDNLSIEFLGWVQKPFNTLQLNSTSSPTVLPSPFELYNKTFNTQLFDRNAVLSDASQRARACYAALRACEITTCSFARIQGKEKIRFSIETLAIKGMNNGQCLVQTTSVDSLYQEPTVVSRCKFPTQDLQYFTNETADYMAGGSPSYFGIQSLIGSWSKAINNNCCWTAPSYECQD